MSSHLASCKKSVIAKSGGGGGTRSYSINSTDIEWQAGMKWLLNTASNKFLLRKAATSALVSAPVCVCFSRGLFLPGFTRKSSPSVKGKVKLQNPPRFDKTGDTRHGGKPTRRRRQKNPLYCTDFNTKMKKPDLSGLRSLSQEMALQIHNPQSGSGEIPAETVYDAIKEEEPRLEALASSDLDLAPLPAEIQEKLGLLSDYSLLEYNKERNWSFIIDQLRFSGGLEGVTPESVYRLAKMIPPRERRTQYPVLERMCKDAAIPVSRKLEMLFFKSFASGRALSDAQVSNLERYFEMIAGENRLKADHYETMVLAYVKTGNMAKVEQLLKDMKTKGLEIGKPVFNAILRGYTYYAKDFDKALQTFDAMKFLSDKTEPDASNYGDMINACVLNNKTEKALDLYQEMLQNHVDVDQKVLSSLAVGCSKKKSLRAKSWELVFKIYDLGWSPSLATYEAMIYICSQDGDVDLARAIFYKMLQSGSVTSKAVAFLMLSYSRFSPSESTNRFKTITITDRGRLFRQSVLDSVDFETNPIAEFPFLPSKTLPEGNAILAECLAVWSYVSENKPDFVTFPFISSLLTTTINLGTLSEFESLFDKCSYANVGKTRLQSLDGEEASDSSQAQLDNFDNSSAANQSRDSAKLPRETALYSLALKAAAKFQSFPLAEKVVAERGLYRKSPSYAALPIRKQVDLDFNFAKSLVHCYADLGLFSDALAVAISSQESFQWGWKELGFLVYAADNIGDRTTAERVREFISQMRMERS
ncbi:uncharacterized protein LODBEIA_P40870 [Lodderomyces beijingensis]|uniref:Mitochondrial 15S rRNA processing factor CCM1 n=1 Tax=Lodderomyces beijingensis TaxID=1775926 RepID=A0ABP0ZNY1_9ASCO